MTPSSNETSGLRHYLATLRRGVLLILIVTVAVTGAAVLQTLRQEKLYRSSVNVFLDPRAVNSSISAVQGSGDPERVLDTQAAAAQIPEIADRALRLAGVPERNGNAFLSQATVVAAPNADILTFAVTDPNPVLARKLTIAYATSYQQYRRESETVALRRARKSLAGDIKRARVAVERGTANTSGLERLLETDRQLEGREQEVELGSTVALGRLPAGATQIQPHPRRNAILGAILGLMLGIGIVFLRDTLNTRVRTAADVEERLGMPLLGRLEQPPKSLPVAQPAADARDPDGPRGRGVPIARDQPRVHEPRPRGAIDHDHQRQPRRGQVDHGREPGGGARALGPARRPHRSRSPPADHLALLRPGRAHRRHRGRARPRDARRSAGPDPAGHVRRGRRRPRSRRTATRARSTTVHRPPRTSAARSAR